MNRPSIPKGEKPSVTIANLERENDNLVLRITELSKRLDRTNQDYSELEARCLSLSDDIGFYQGGVEEVQAKVAKLESILCGYRQAIADVHHTGVEMVRE